MADYDALIREAADTAERTSKVMERITPLAATDPARSAVVAATITAANAIAHTRLLASILERLDTPTARPGPCADTYTVGYGAGASRVSCVLNHGHTGAHTDRAGATWQPVTFDTRDTRRCDNPHPSIDGVTCERFPGHDADHLNGCDAWRPRDTCSAAWGWDPDTVCERGTGHDGTHTARGVRWGDGLCAVPDERDPDRVCTLDTGHVGFHGNGSRHWPAHTDTAAGLSQALTDLATRLRPICGAVADPRHLLTDAESGELASIALALEALAKDTTPTVDACGHTPGGDPTQTPCTRAANHPGLHRNEDESW